MHYEQKDAKTIMNRIEYFRGTSDFSRFADMLVQQIHITPNGMPTKEEATGRRISYIAGYVESLKKNTFNKCYLVTANRAINKDVSSRYAIIQIADNGDAIIPSYLFNEYIPIFVYESIDNMVFSKMFRENMGTQCTMIDIDYIITPDNMIYVIEEKTGSSTMGVGQSISYREFANDVLSKSYAVRCPIIAHSNADGSGTMQYGEKIQQYHDFESFKYILNSYAR